jgi:hypothetical protein
MKVSVVDGRGAESLWARYSARFEEFGRKRSMPVPALRSMAGTGIRCMRKDFCILVSCEARINIV